LKKTKFGENFQKVKIKYEVTKKQITKLIEKAITDSVKFVQNEND